MTFNVNCGMGKMFFMSRLLIDVFMNCKPFTGMSMIIDYGRSKINLDILILTPAHSDVHYCCFKFSPESTLCVIIGLLVYIILN